MISFKDKTAIVTGSARGIGRVIAEKFLALGANVVVCDLHQEAVDAAVAEMKGSTLGVAGNVVNADDVTRLFEATIAKFGRVDIVVNNAGITRDGFLVRLSEKDWDMVLDTNLKGAFLVTKSAARLMMKQRAGRIINISSVVGLDGNAGQSNYSASKAGLLGLTKSGSKELASRGITVNAVAPGYIETDMTRDLPEAAKQGFLDDIPLGIPGQPEDVAAAVMFLASDEAAYITGHVLTVDGGLSL